MLFVVMVVATKSWVLVEVAVAVAVLAAPSCGRTAGCGVKEKALFLKEEERRAMRAVTVVRADCRRRERGDRSVMVSVVDVQDVSIPVSSICSCRCQQKRFF